MIDGIARVEKVVWKRYPQYFSRCQ